MRNSLTPLEKRLAAYAAAAGVALAVAPASDAQIVYTDLDPDLCVHFARVFIDVDADGVDDFSFFQYTMGSGTSAFRRGGFFGHNDGPVYGRQR